MDSQMEWQMFWFHNIALVRGLGYNTYLYRLQNVPYTANTHLTEVHRQFVWIHAPGFCSYKTLENSSTWTILLFGQEHDVYYKLKADADKPSCSIAFKKFEFCYYLLWTI